MTQGSGDEKMDQACQEFRRAVAMLAGKGFHPTESPWQVLASRSICFFLMELGHGEGIQPTGARVMFVPNAEGVPESFVGVRIFRSIMVDIENISSIDFQSLRSVLELLVH